MKRLKKILIAPDSFKGSLSSIEAANAMKAGVEEALKVLDIDSRFIIKTIPLSDGGEGFARVAADVLEALEIKCKAHDPLMREIDAKYYIKGEEAFIDFAEASGLPLLDETERNPMVTSSYGTGEIIYDVIKKGAKKIFLGLGGSATNDAALGALQALGLKIFDEFGKIFGQPIKGSDIINIGKFEYDQLKDTLKEVEILLVCDVDNRFYGEDGAACVFAPQKGASIKDVGKLDNGLRKLAILLKNSGFIDVSDLKGSGAAGGAGGGFMAFTGAKRKRGIDFVLDLYEFDKEIEDSILILTGEGKADLQTLMGKVGSGVLSRGLKKKVPIVLLAGKIEDCDKLKSAGFSDVVSINTPETDILKMMDKEIARRNLSSTAKRIVLSNLFTKFAMK